MTLSRRPWLRGALISALAAAVYAGTLRNGLVWDDRLTATAPMLGPQPGQWWRPVVMASFAGELALHGGVAAAMHLTNVLLHAAVGILLDRWTLSLGLAPPAALLGALGFTLHPVQSEAVAYVSGRTDVLCALFLLLGFLAWRRASRAADRWAWTTTCLFVLAFGCKEAALLSPLVLLVPRAHPQGAQGPRPALAVIAAMGWAALFSARGLVDLRLGDLGGRLPAMAAMGLDYVCLLVWPAHLHLERFVAVGGWSTAGAVPVVLAALAVVAALVCLAWPTPAGGVLLVLAASTYLPVAGIVPVYPAIADRALFAAEHFLYLPLLGLAPLVAGALVSHWPRAARPLGIGLAVVVFAGWGVRGMLRVEEWRDEETLFRHTLRYDPPAARVWYNLGNLRLAAGDAAEAARLFEAALQREPGSAAAHLNLGIAFARLGQHEEALRQYAEALRLDPSLAAAFRSSPP